MCPEIQNKLKQLQDEEGGLSDEHKKKISKSLMGHIISDETRKKISKTKMGSHHSKETRRKMSESQRGHLCSDETKRKVSLAHKDKKLTDEHKHNISQAKKGTHSSPTTEFKNGDKGHLGYKHSEEYKQKMSDAKKGQIISEETRRKMALANTGKTRSDEIKQKMSKIQRRLFAEGKIPPMKGKHFSSEHKLKIGLANRKNVGSLASAWRGGKSREEYTYEFNMMLKQKIRERDNYTCFVCGRRGMSVHHTDYNKVNCEEKNLVTLCSSCHSKTNFNREYWEECFNGNSYGTKIIA